MFDFSKINSCFRYEGDTGVINCYKLAYFLVDTPIREIPEKLNLFTEWFSLLFKKPRSVIRWGVKTFIKTDPSFTIDYYADEFFRFLVYFGFRIYRTPYIRGDMTDEI